MSPLEPPASHPAASHPAASNPAASNPAASHPASSSPVAPSSDCAISLQTRPSDGRSVLVGVRDGEVVSDEELRARDPQLGRTLVMLRRMDHIMARTVDARSRRGTLLAELAEWFWNEDVSETLSSGDILPSHASRRRPRAQGRTVGTPQPILDARSIFQLPEFSVPE